ncbi:response regulator [Psychrosphaera sp. B3R10]|uniref:LytR/AlgR family response regulator transcription factor n=1 Tax=unclassified Psychrosphaera TaxID=2641570 RepID=UPI001C0978B8|nr:MULTISPECIES: response regulator [unclassified Psychrosphaera]MBU2881274.1 response regulator [Psychrosphaera sp. I2R16]MBU2988373.1 response regulator [Psychrosphaera sp. B3R10]
MENLIKTIIVDDEPLARKGLAIRLKEFEEIELLAQCSNGAEAIEVIVELKPKLVFLDIQMPGLTGFDVIHQLQQRNIVMPMIVFVTAYDQFALKAFEVHAIDYLLKPVDDARLLECINKIRSQIDNDMFSHQQNKLIDMMSQLTGTDTETIIKNLADGEEIEVKEYNNYISVKDVGETTRLPVSEVIWVDAAGDYMCVHCTDGETHILRKTMKQLEEELDPKLFVRVHRSVLVNNTSVKKVLTLSSGEYVIQISNGHEIRVSRSYREKVRTLFL